MLYIYATRTTDMCTARPVQMFLPPFKPLEDHNLSILSRRAISNLPKTSLFIPSTTNVPNLHHSLPPPPRKNRPTRKTTLRANSPDGLPRRKCAQAIFQPTSTPVTTPHSTQVVHCKGKNIRGKNLLFSPACHSAIP